MKKIYIKPDIEVFFLTTLQPIAASGGTETIEMMKTEDEYKEVDDFEFLI